MSVQVTTIQAGSWGRFARHFVEMIVAMLVGMAVLYPVWSLVTGGLAEGHPLRGVVAETLAMAATMSIGMAAWMRFHRHPWAPVLEMSAAMFAGFVVLYPAYWMGALSASDVMMVGHVLMIGFMLVAMLLRRDEYAADHRAHRHG
ncbi:MAG: hypothetical protein ACRDO4_12440 [Nocardioides sp.]